MDHKFCIYCGTRLTLDAVFCSNCGRQQPKVQEQAVPQPENMPRPTSVIPKPPKKPCRFRISDIIRNSILIIVSLVMLILAFCPIISAAVEYHEYELHVNMSAVDQITLLFDSFMEIEEENLEHTKMYKEYLKMCDDYSSYFYFIDYSEVKANSVIARDLSKLCFLWMRLNARHEDFTAPAVYYIAAAASIVYIVNAIALFVFSILNLITAFKVIKDEKRRIFKWTVRALTLTPTLLLIAFSAISVAICRGTTPSMTSNAVNTLILSISAIIAFFVLRLIFDKSERKLRILPRIIATALSIVVICLSFSPVFSASVSTVFGNSSYETTAIVKMSASFFTDHHVDDETKDEYEDQLQSMTQSEKKEHLSNTFHRFDSLTEEETDSVYATSINNTLLVNLFGCKVEEEMLDLISLVGILFIGALGGAAVILWQNASYLAADEYSEKTVLIGKLASAIFAAGGLAVSVIYLIVVRNFEKLYLPEGYKLSLAAGVICLAIFAIGSIFCPHKMAPRVTKNDTEAPAETVAE